MFALRGEEGKTNPDIWDLCERDVGKHAFEVSNTLNGFMMKAMKAYRASCNIKVSIQIMHAGKPFKIGAIPEPVASEMESKLQWKFGLGPVYRFCLSQTLKNTVGIMPAFPDPIEDLHTAFRDSMEDFFIWDNGQYAGCVFWQVASELHVGNFQIQPTAKLHLVLQSQCVVYVVNIRNPV